MTATASGAVFFYQSNSARLEVAADVQLSRTVLRPV